MNNNTHSAESVKLLNGSLSTSESEVDVQFAMVQPVTSNGRRKVRTKRRSRSTALASKNEASSGYLCSVFSVVKVAGVTVCIGGTVILTWLVLMLQSEVQLLTNRIASASYSGTNLTALTFENRHGLEQLSANQSQTWLKIKNFTEEFLVLSKQVSSLRSEFREVKDSWKDAAQVTNMGKELEGLKQNLAVFGAELATVKSVINSTGMSNWQTTLQELNKTLSSKIEWAVEDLHKHHEMITSLENGIRNVTEDVSVLRDSSSRQADSIQKRVETLHSAISVLEAHQRNTTLTMQYVLSVLQNVDKGTN